MKKIILSVTMLAIAASTIFVACKKGEATQVKTDTSKTEFLRFGGNRPWSQAANSANSYDSAGLLHNLALEYILDSLSIDSLEIPSNIYDATVGYIYTNYGSTEANNYTNNYTLNDQTTLSNHFTGLNFENPNFVPIIASFNYSTNVTNELNDLFNFTDTTVAYDYDTIKAKVMLWELDVINSSYSNQEKELLLRTSSTFRYSLFGWENAVYPNSSSGNILYKTTRNGHFWKALIKVVATAACDALGAAAAAPMGPVGSFVAGAGMSAIINTWKP